MGPEWTTVITADNNLWALLIENMRDVVRVARVIRQHLKIQRWCHSCCCWEKVCIRAPHATAVQKKGSVGRKILVCRCNIILNQLQSCGLLIVVTIKSQCNGNSDISCHIVTYIQTKQIFEMLVLYALADYWIDADQSQVCSRLLKGWFSE